MTDPAFLDDFYSECDEHLTEIRRAVARLEEQQGQTPDANIWQGLLRQMHSLKGVMGIAGLPEPERLAHATESYLRALAQEKRPLTVAHFDALTGVARTLEQVLAAHRQHQPLPELSGAIDNLNRLAAEMSCGPAAALAVVTSVEPEPSTPPPPASDRAKLYHAHFSPSAELNQRGVNINSVRARLQELGQIVQSEPVISKEHGISFEFVVSAPEEVADLASWNSDGLSLQPQETRAATPSSVEHPVPEPAAATPAYVAPSHIVRVDLSKLDELVQSLGELVLYRARLESSLNRVSQSLPTKEARDLQEVNYSLGKELRRLRDGLMRLRLVPLAEVFERMSLVVRDLSREGGRKIQLTLKGQETQLDKYLVERLKDPLLHLVRNAAAHGAESAGERAARGKPEALQIRLEAATVGESVVIRVHDDGAGIREDKVRQRAKAAGLAVHEPLTPAGLLDLLCTPGFSTRTEADLGAGRGVGMSVVKNTIAELGGQLTLESVAGQGTTFTLQLPLTLAIADALLLLVGNQQFLLPQAAVQEIATVRPAAVKHLETREFMRYREGILPLLRLSRLFHLVGAEQPEYPVLVLGFSSDRVGVLVDRVIGHREIIVRPLSDPLLKLPGVSGATELGDGRAVLILDPAGLLEMARIQPAQAAG